MVGEHACLTYSDADERLDLLSAFVVAGLDRGERVICCTDADDLRAALVDRGAGGPLSVEPTRWLWGDGAVPDAQVMVRRLRAALREAEEQGCFGLRFTADMCWAARPQAGAEQLLAFESEVGTLFGDGRVTGLCEYDRDSFDPVTLAYATRVHRRTVTATVYHESPDLRICRQHVPPGVRLAGELDHRRAGALAGALAEAVRLDPDVHLNLNRLRALDEGAAAVILRTAAGLPPSRRMVVVCDGEVDRTLRSAGADDVPQLRVLVRHAER